LLNIISYVCKELKLKDMNVFDKLEELELEIAKSRIVTKELEASRICWCKNNRKEIKKLYPKKNIIYAMTDISLALCSYHPYRGYHDEKYFFKVNDIRFSPDNDFTGYRKPSPTVLGDVLDINLNVVNESERVYISELISIEQENKPSKLSNNFTKVYVMIDKNTGYYKIGRSKNPNQREKTLQSEKPTIEMLFNRDARVKDEKKLHDMFDKKRVRGEWFDLKGSDLGLIKEYFDNPN